MFYAKKTYDNAPEFLKSERYQNISCTVSDTGVTADEYGKKFVLAGTLLDAAGKAVKITRIIGGAVIFLGVLILLLALLIKF